MNLLHPNNLLSDDRKHKKLNDLLANPQLNREDKVLKVRVDSLLIAEEMLADDINTYEHNMQRGRGHLFHILSARIDESTTRRESCVDSAIFAAEYALKAGSV